MKITRALAITMIGLSIISCNNRVTNKPLTNEIDSVSYAIGLDMATKIKINFKDINSDLFVQGYLNGVDSTSLLLNTKQATDVLNTFFQKLRVKKMQEQREAAIKKAEKEFGHLKKEGEAFLAKNKSVKGVKTTASGLQYMVIKEGKGKKPSPTSTVKVHYHGTSIDGKVFDSSVERKQPYELRANQFVKGFTEGLLLMNQGSKYKFFIPQELAYGATPRPGGVIKPFMALVFEVELLEVK
ncbi:MAG: FKBP-type peptidyl-prolyl cis-trans isomerase [Flavobacteriaceae bacterium]|nr:FKBP-type peptidyl-prolyl cis-trans isomerase [Flavobacteriaceae bacterium]